MRRTRFSTVLYQPSPEVYYVLLHINQGKIILNSINMKYIRYHVIRGVEHWTAARLFQHVLAEACKHPDHFASRSFSAAKAKLAHTSSSFMDGIAQPCPHRTVHLLRDKHTDNPRQPSKQYPYILLQEAHVLRSRGRSTEGLNQPQLPGLRGGGICDTFPGFPNIFPYT